MCQVIFYDRFIYVMLDVFTQKQSIILIFRGEICYVHHGQGRDGMI